MPRCKDETAGKSLPAKISDKPREARGSWGDNLQSRKSKVRRTPAHRQQPIEHSGSEEEEEDDEKPAGKSRKTAPKYKDSSEGETEVENGDVESKQGI